MKRRERSLWCGAEARANLAAQLSSRVVHKVYLRKLPNSGGVELDSSLDSLSLQFTLVWGERWSRVEWDFGFSTTVC